MGKPSAKKKLQTGVEKVMKQNKAERSSKQTDEDPAVFIQMSHELKEEGNRLFQKHDNEGAMLKYEKALKLLPLNHVHIASLRSNMAACYMQMGVGEYPRAIHECNLALEVSPRCSMALLKRARCYEALNEFELALSDVRSVLSLEPNNVMALEIEDMVKKAIENKGLKVEEVEDESSGLKSVKMLKKKTKKRKNKGVEKVGQRKLEGEEVKENKVEEGKDKMVQRFKDRRIDLNHCLQKKDDGGVCRRRNEGIDTRADCQPTIEEIATRMVKLVLRDDIRWAELPISCSIGLVREIVWDRFPGLEGVLIKYKDHEGDLITITTNAELRLAEASGDPQGSLRLHLVEVSPDKEPFYEGFRSEGFPTANKKTSYVSKNDSVGKIKEVVKVTTCIEDWIVRFARLFKDHLGFNSDSYLDLYGLGMKRYSDTVEEVVTSENAQKLLDVTGEKFQEMAALGLFNWGNAHMNKARKWVVFAEEGTKESFQEQMKTGYKRAEKEYVNAGVRYEEALKIKPDFFEGFFALGQLHFEQAKLSWCYAVGTILEAGPSAQILALYDKAEDNMEHAMQIWEDLEEQWLNGLSLNDNFRDDLVNLGLDGFLKDISSDETAEQAAHLRYQMYILWGTLLYERSVFEFKMGLSAWEEALSASVEKFELAGASTADLAEIMKNHCSNGTASESNFHTLRKWSELHGSWMVSVLERVHHVCLNYVPDKFYTVL